MSVLDIIKWFKGYVTVEVCGENASAFLSFLAVRLLSVQNVRRNDNCISFTLSLKDYKIIRALKHDFSQRVKIRHKKLVGFPQKMLFLVNRKSIAIGLVLFFAVLFSFSRFIWKIEIKGNKAVTEQEIVLAYTELGVFRGMPKSSLDSYSIRDKFPLMIDKISWCSFNLEGSVLTVNITEVKESDKSNKLAHSNLIAECDGIIKKIDVVSGYTKVKVGDVVARGEVLVSGAPENTGGFTWSMGEVIAQTEHSFKITIKKKKEIIIKGELTEDKSIIDIFGLKIPLYLDAIHYENVSEVKSYDLRIFGEKLPITIITRSFTQATKKFLELDEEQAKNDSLALLLSNCKEQGIESLEILEIYKSEDAENYYFNYRCRCLEDIAQVSKINVTS